MSARKWPSVVRDQFAFVCTLHCLGPAADGGLDREVEIQFRALRAAEHRDDALDLIMRLKRTFDPLNLLDPGKIVRV
jgi:FAD/FMN-containing dehydrogenase